MAVVIETTVGDLTVDLFTEERPRACLNFLKLCKLKYYNFNLFHNVEHGFIAQTGDPTGAGDGGESVWGVVEGPHKRYFESESLPKIKHSVPGLLSMVSLGKNMVGSQFFFTLGPDLFSLDGLHCVIGEVAEGHEVLRKLNEAIVDDKFRPYQDIRITHTVILEDPFDDPRGFQIPSRSPSPSVERLKNGRIGADEDIDDTEGKTTQEIQEMLQEREAKARATILEIVGDLPDANIAPPENVLFVCKLNPVTTDDDLEIIFSRFGKVKSCEVIRDKVTEDSLQYAFVEFEDKKSCENAYFKMDNVLIDDRRIHVDFSQSVAKVKWRGKGRGVIHQDSKNNRLDFNNLRGDKNRPSNSDRNMQRNRSRSPQRYSNRQPQDRQDYRSQRNRENNYHGEKSWRQRSPNNRMPYRPRSRSPYNRPRNRSPNEDRDKSYKKHSRSPNRRLYRPKSRSPNNGKEKYRQRNRSPDKGRVNRRSPSPNHERMARRSRSPDKRKGKYIEKTRKTPSPVEKERSSRKSKATTADERKEKRKRNSSSSPETKKKKKKSKKQKKHKKHRSSSSSSSD